MENQIRVGNCQRRIQEVKEEAPIFYYEGTTTRIPISPKDISCLGYSKVINDQIIDFWLSVVFNEVLSEEDRKRTFVYDCFFYSKLTEKKMRTAEDVSLTAAERRYARVKKRTKNVDIFDKDFLIIPIYENGQWFVVIICFPGMQGIHDYDTLELLPNFKRSKLTTSTGKHMGAASSDDSRPSPAPSTFEITSEPERKAFAVAGEKRKNETSRNGPRVKQPCIILFDSLSEYQRARVFSTLREYLQMEYKAKRNVDRVFDKNTMPAMIPKVPQQLNLNDDGLFMLQYIESFFSDPPPSYELRAINLKFWFHPTTAENKGKEIFYFIKDQIELKCPENLTRIPEVDFGLKGTDNETESESDKSTDFDFSDQ